MQIYEYRNNKVGFQFYRALEGGVSSCLCDSSRTQKQKYEPAERVVLRYTSLIEDLDRCGAIADCRKTKDETRMLSCSPLSLEV
jgi:hypothetical protein